MGALTVPRVTGVQSASQVETLIKGQKAESTFKLFLDSTFLREFLVEGGTGDFTTTAKTPVRANAGLYWGTSVDLPINSSVTVLQRVGNFAQIGDRAWISSSVLGTAVTDAAILKVLKSYLLDGITHALEVMTTNYKDYMTADGFTAASINSLVTIAANKAIALTAANMGYSSS